MRASLVLRLRKLMTQTARRPSVAWQARGQALRQGKAGATPKNDIHLPQFTLDHGIDDAPSRPSSRSVRAARQPCYGRSPPADAPDDDYDDDGQPWGGT